MGSAETLLETTKWLNVNNHRCNLWEVISSLSRAHRLHLWLFTFNHFVVSSTFSED